MVRHFLLAVCLVVCATTGLFAQERVGGGRIEGGVYPAGAMFFSNGANASEPGFGAYSIGGWAGYNVNRHFGLVGEFGLGLARTQDFDFASGRFDSVASQCDACSSTGLRPTPTKRSVYSWSVIGCLLPM